MDSFEAGVRRSAAPQRHFAILGLPLAALAFLALTAGLSLFWSHSRLLFRDEYYEIWTDRVASLARIIQIQRSTPVALDPLTYHVFAHASIILFGVNAFAIRLPALLGVLTMQLCLFAFVRRISTERAAIFAMGLPALTYVLSYSAEGRPYGLMLGLFGLAMICWQAASRHEPSRAMALMGLAVTVALALNTQYFGVLLLAPLGVAELFRALQRRRVDVPMVVALAAGTAGIAFVIPFISAAKAFQGAYGTALLSPKAIVWAYVWALANHPTNKFSLATLVVVLVVACIALWALGQQLAKQPLMRQEPEVIFLVALSGLPLFGYVLALLTSPSLEPRYVIGLVIGVSALSGMGLFALCRHAFWQRVIIVGLFVVVASTGIIHIANERETADRMTQSMKLPEEVLHALLIEPDRKLYIQDFECFAATRYYEANADVRSRTVLLYSHEQEVKWNQVGIIAETALNLHDFADIPIASYESIVSSPGAHMFVDFVQPATRLGLSRNWNWLGLALAADHADVRLIGSGFRGSNDIPSNVLSVTFIPRPGSLASGRTP